MLATAWELMWKLLPIILLVGCYCCYNDDDDGDSFLRLLSGSHALLMMNEFLIRSDALAHTHTVGDSFPFATQVDNDGIHTD